MRTSQLKEKEIQILYIERENAANVTIGFRVAKLGRGVLLSKFNVFNSISTFLL